MQKSSKKNTQDLVFFIVFSKYLVFNTQGIFNMIQDWENPGSLVIRKNLRFPFFTLNKRDNGLWLKYQLYKWEDEVSQWDIVVLVNIEDGKDGKIQGLPKQELIIPDIQGRFMDDRNLKICL